MKDRSHLPESHMRHAHVSDVSSFTFAWVTHASRPRVWCVIMCHQYVINSWSDTVRTVPISPSHIWVTPTCSYVWWVIDASSETSLQLHESVSCDRDWSTMSNYITLHMLIRRLSSPTRTVTGLTPLYSFYCAPCAHYIPHPTGGHHDSHQRFTVTLLSFILIHQFIIFYLASTCYNYQSIAKIG